MKRERERWQKSWRHVGRGKPLFPKHPPSGFSSITQADHTATLHRTQKRAVCVHPHFHTTSGHCCNASQIQASLSQTHPILSNRELCKPMQRPFYSLCYSKLSMGAVDKEMQSRSPLTPGSLCKQYGELLGTLLITL